MNQINEIDSKVQCIVHELRNDKDWINLKRSVVRAPQILKQKVNIGYKLPKDEQFDTLYSKFQDIDEKIIFLETEVMRYTSHVRAYINRSISVCESLSKVFDPNIASSGNPYNTNPSSPGLKLCAQEDHQRFRTSQKYVVRGLKLKTNVCVDLDLVSNNVQIPLTRLVGIMKNIKRFIKEREYALIDVNKYYDDFESLNAKEKSTLTLKQQQNLIRYEKNYELSKLKFEQINDTLKKDLPELIRLVGDFIQPLHVLLYYLQLTIHYQFMQEFGELTDNNFKSKMRNNDLHSFVESTINEFHNKQKAARDLVEGLYITKFSTERPILPSSAETVDQAIGDALLDLESNSTVNQFCIAKYNYQAQEGGDLSFKKGDRIKIIDQKLKDWWKGELNGQTGLFPHNYVELDN